MGLKRVLGPVDAGWLVAGNMIGAGIFFTPGLVAGRLPGLLGPLVAWTLGGVLALLGAAVYGELGARLPRAGGDYQYLAVAFGPIWGFLTGWAALLLTFSAAAAVMSLVAVDYLASAVWGVATVPGVARPAAAALTIVLLTVANTAGARVAGRTTAWFTAVPLAGLVGLFGVGLLAGRGAITIPPITVPTDVPWPLALGAAMVPVYFTYSGWNAAAYMAAEIREPGRNLVRGLLGGTGAVVLVYLLVNLILLVAVPQESLAGSTTAGAQAAERLLGPAAQRPLSFLIALAVLGSANVTLMAGARVYYAMAVDGLAPTFLAETNRAGVPAAALWLGGIWTALLVTVGRVQVLINWATMAILLLSSLTVAALFVLRRRDPSFRGYRCPGYPLTPVVYLLASLAVAVSSAVNEPRQSLYGFLLVMAGFPIYALVRRWLRVRT